MLSSGMPRLVWRMVRLPELGQEITTELGQTSPGSWRQWAVVTPSPRRLSSSQEPSCTLNNILARPSSEPSPGPLQWCQGTPPGSLGWPELWRCCWRYLPAPGGIPQSLVLCIAMHSGATPLLRGCSRKNIFCQKIFDNFFSFQATEIVLTSKWGRIQPEIQI